MHSVFREARWIWGGVPFHDLQNSFVLLRKSFELLDLPACAPLFISADQSYRLYLNSQFVGRGPARGFQSSWPYDEWDVAPLLRTGTNVLAVRAHHPGCGTFSYISQHMAGVLVALSGEIGGEEFRLHSDSSWKAWRQTNVRKDVVPSSLQLFPQEHIDLRDEPQNWVTAEFDDSGWASASALATWNCPPWNDLEARGIPPLREGFLAPHALVGEAEGEAAPHFGDVRDVVRLAVEEGLKHSTVSAAFEGVLTVEATEKGRFRSFVLDFGRVHVGNLEVEIKGARGGEIVDFLHCEVTREDDATAPTQTPLHEPDDDSRVVLGTRLICREGAQKHAFFHINGFRFLTLRVRDSQATLEITPVLNTVGYPLPRTGKFASSDALLERIWDACAHTEAICSLDAYVDTPWREQAQWWGDARVQAWNTFHLCDDARLLRRGIRQIGAQQLPNGLTYGHAPTIAHTCVLPDFTLIWMVTQWDYFWQTGSLDAFQAHRDQTERALAYFRAQSDEKTGLVKCDARYWLFLDWTCLPKDGVSSVLNLWLVLALEKLAQMHRLSGDENAAAPLEAWAQTLRRALENLIVDGLLNDGLKPNGELHDHFSIHSQTLALMLDLRGLDQKKALEEVLLPFLALDKLPDHNQVIMPSAYWVTYVFSILSERGHGAAVVRFIRQHWEPMARFGSTWESYADRLAGGSRSHAWSAHPLFHLMQTIGGLVQTAPHWQKVRFAPVFEGTSGGATIPTPHGLLISRWDENATGIDVSLEIPAGIEAEIVLPGQTQTRGAGRHEWVISWNKAGRW